MRALWVLALAGLMLPCASSAEDGAGNVRFEFDTTVNAVLIDTLDSRKNKPGDAVRARTSEDVQANGVIIIPRGTKLIGQVTEAQTAARKTEHARLGIVFDRAELKNGRQVPLHTTFYALAAPQGATNSRSAVATGGFGGGLGSGGASIGDLMSASTSADETSALNFGRSPQEFLKPSPGAVGGLNGSGTLYGSSRGVFGLSDISLEPNADPNNGSSVILENARSVHLSIGTRLLLSVDSKGQG